MTQKINQATSQTRTPSIQPNAQQRKNTKKTQQNKKAEENNKKYLADRKAKTLKEYGLDKPLIVNNGNIQTEKLIPLLKKNHQYYLTNLKMF